MAENELLRRLEELKSWDALIDEAKAKREEIVNSLKEEMEERDTEHLNVANRYMLNWSTVVKNVFQTSLFKKSNPSTYADWCRTQESKRFSYDEI